MPGGQDAVIAFLEDPATHGGRPVERIETHGAIVFLVGDTAYKMKKAVHLGPMDFSTLARREACCTAEIEINRRTAPMLYRRAVPVTDEGGGRLAIGGAGRPVEWLVEMARFDTGDLLDRVLAEGRAPGGLGPALARAVAALHATAQRLPDAGGADAVAAIVEGNLREMDEFVPAVFDHAAAARLRDASLAAVAAHRDLLEARRAAGYVRRCHGDLHPGNIVLMDGAPVLFDAIEFSDRIAHIDVLYDLAFLLMELWHENAHAPELALASAVFNGYVEALPHAELADQVRGLALLPLFMSMRAGVRAKISARMTRTAAARAYFAAACADLDGAPPCLVAVGGLSGSGKSGLARGLAPGLGRAPGALVLRSDVIRKQLAGIAPEDALPPDAYTREAARDVYAEMARLARMALGAGQAVAMDAVFAREEERAAAAAVAEDAGVPFAGLWLDAPAAVLKARADERAAARAAGTRRDASDADARVVEAQLAHDPGTIAWTRLDAARAPADVLAQARAALARHGQSA